MGSSPRTVSLRQPLTSVVASDEAETTTLLGGAGLSDEMMIQAEIASSWAEEEDQLSREKLQMIKVIKQPIAE